ncbi:metalloregulator ArsR/SmtB family transcription factor [Halostella sp. PRR32]|uniref:ArsR/SmtB family transcription factor n=1 Tax=Halostella sp. PRR32 TaxID=3098147 RepID=UPI002B1E299C|nr:metalloregulator ArsR/SmtB family transcription factor [Halostella sp. PRR32]
MDSESDIPGDVGRETLERLYDENPDDQVSELVGYRSDDETLEGERTVFRALANRDRLQLLEALRHGELCGCELMIILDAPQSTVATHVRKLREAGLVKSRKKGRWNYYRIADTAVEDILGLAAAIDTD